MPASLKRAARSFALNVGDGVGDDVADVSCVASASNADCVAKMISEALIEATVTV